MGERDVADSENTDSTADGGVGNVRIALLPLPLSRGEQWAVGERWLCHLCGGADLVLSDLGESLMHNAPECCDGWLVWKAVLKEGNQDYQERKK